MLHRFSRTEQLTGPAGLERLARSRVAVFGAGGVGGFAIEALARAGVGALDIIDHDAITLTNCNRQILALESTLGRNKAEAAKERVRDINPACRAAALPVFFSAETSSRFDLTLYDYVADAIDTVSAKLALIEACKAAGTPIISCLGTGNKLDPAAFRVDFLENTSVCPLARVMRRECKRRGLTNVKVVYSTEPPLPSLAPAEHKGSTGHPAPGSISFVPAAAGLLLASAIVKDLLAQPEKRD